MKYLAGFTPEEIALILAAGVAYFLMSWAPLILPLAATHKHRATFPRRWLFAIVILALAYGVIVAFLTLITIPLTAYSVFIVPQLSFNGFHLTDGLVGANQYVADFWWLVLPPVLLLNSFMLVRKLRPAWSAICIALTANNSFKPKPLPLGLIQALGCTPNMKQIVDALATYVELLAHSAHSTTRAEDRVTYTKHLAAAAEIFACLHSDHLSQAKEMVRAQRHDFGWGHLSGEEGSAAEAGFDRFATIIESSHAP